MTKKWCVPCLRGGIGSWVYYSALMTPQQIASYVDPSKDIREAEELDDFLQRSLKTRYNKISKYLLQRDDRFFNSIIIGVFDALPEWVQFDLSPMAQTLDIPEVIGVEESLGILIFDGQEKMFAIDGQHRSKGIATALNANPDRFKDDEYSVIFVAHEDDKMGKVRTRRLFCDINKNAVAVSDGDRVVIDEDELCAITTRRLFAEYKPFVTRNAIGVTEKKELVSKDGIEYFTSLLSLYTVCKRLKPLSKMPLGSIESAPANVSQLQTIVSDFFDFIIAHDASLNLYFTSGQTTPQEQREGNRNLFFRPIGLELLARFYAHFHAKGKLNVLALAMDSSNLNFENPGGVWSGILWNNGRITTSGKAPRAAYELVMYLLGELKTEKEEDLQELLRDVYKDRNYILPPKLTLLAT